MYSSSLFRTNHKDFWEYDPLLNSWIQKANIPTNGRGFAVGLSIGMKGYIGEGQDDFGNRFDDFLEYNPATDTWSQKTNFPGGQRNDIDGGHFTISNYGYVGTGGNGLGMKDFWQYNQSTDTWMQIPNLPAQSRMGAIGFSLNNKGYIGLGGYITATSPYINCLHDLWEYTDTTLHEGINELALANSISVYPNPSADGKFTVYSLPAGQAGPQFPVNSIDIYNVAGKLVYHATVNSKQETVNLSEAQGVYFLHLTTDKGNVTKRIVVSR